MVSIGGMGLCCRVGGVFRDWMGLGCRVGGWLRVVEMVRMLMGWVIWVY